MSDSSPVVVRIANTPAQARLFVSMLEAEGIPAFVDGDSLTDEFAMSRKLMNLASVRVMVPPSSLERAREILQPVAVDEEDLARQAEAAADGETPPRPRGEGGASGRSRMGWVTIAAVAAAFVFFGMWQRAQSLVSADPHLRPEPAPNGVMWVSRSSGEPVYLLVDADGDGRYERTEHIGRDDAYRMISDRFDEHGRATRITEKRTGDLTVTWEMSEAGTFDIGVVTDDKGNVLQRLRWVRGEGYVIEKP